LVLTLIVEAVEFVDLCGFVVAAQEEEVFGVLDLVAEQQHHGLDGLLAAVHIVAQEEVVLFGGESAVVEDFEQVLELPMDIAHDLDGGFQFQQHRLRQEDLSRHLAHSLDLVLRHFHISALLLTR
jgi:hypothetical protein